MPLHPYGEDFFTDLDAGSESSSLAIMPAVVDAVHPRSIIDVGCGRAAWLAAAAALGIDDVLGVDGDYVDRHSVLIEPGRFLAHDLTMPLRVSRMFDLAISLEVGEHLPEESAPTLVDSLTRAAPVVLFSAAVPHQPGTRHVNCQWPEYWARLFRERRFLAFDPIRLPFWDDPRVEYWYAQNAVMFVSTDQLAADPGLGERLGGVQSRLRAMVHPALYAQLNEVGVAGSARALRAALRARLQRERDRVVRQIGRPRHGGPGNR